MRNIDHTQLESEFNGFEADQFEYAFEGDQEIFGKTDMESPFTEAEEMELAAELLEVSDEAELDQFLGKLFKGAWKGLKKVGSIVGKVAGPLSGVLKGLAKKTLPFVGGALGSLIPIPGVGTAVGTALGSAVSKALEAEFEGMNEEDQEFEMARRFVRLAGTAAQQAAQAEPGIAPQFLQDIAKTAVMAAARQHVPGLGQASTTLPPPTAPPIGQTRRSGRWVRRGSKIILLGA